MFGISSFMYQRVHTFGHHLHTNERGADPDIEVHGPGCPNPNPNPNPNPKP